ncbi:MAG TPA: mevalonate kinase [Legionella sp.]|nr:mevalonate kinase [Legionella sp.]
MFYDFTTTTYGKWILAGEHAVVRGHGALVFPIKKKQFSLNFNASSPSLTAESTGSSGEDMSLLFWSVLEHGMQLLHKPLNKISGRFSLHNEIPVGVGMGASAALCVALSRWFVAQKMIDDSRCTEFARELEHLFHGKSSGLDIAGVAADEGIYFEKGCLYPLKSVIHPLWYLSSCEQIGITANCIKQVNDLWVKNPEMAQQIDDQMISATQECKLALENGGDDAIARLAHGLNKAAQCFYQWGLVSDLLDQHMNDLLRKGAIAVKPTGSGGGGFVLSLWNSRPPETAGLIEV